LVPVVFPVTLLELLLLLEEVGFTTILEVEEEDDD
jgi:hypothetical protein